MKSWELFWELGRVSLPEYGKLVYTVRLTATAFLRSWRKLGYDIDIRVVSLSLLNNVWVTFLFFSFHVCVMHT